MWEQASPVSGRGAYSVCGESFAPSSGVTAAPQLCSTGSDFSTPLDYQEHPKRLTEESLALACCINPVIHATHSREEENSLSVTDFSAFHLGDPKGQPGSAIRPGHSLGKGLLSVLCVRHV